MSNKNFEVKHGLSVGGTQRISSAGVGTFTDLNVTGTTTTIDTATLQVQDKNIVINYGSGDTSSTASGAGITIQDAVNSSTDATLLWDASADEFDFSHTVTAPSLTIAGNATFDTSTLVVDSSNNRVGIGTASPSASLHVAHGSDTSDLAQFSGGHASRYLAIKSFQNDSLDGAGFIFNATSSAGAFKFQTATTDRVTIDSSGRVGIGTSSPGAPLHITNATPVIRLTDSDTSRFAQIVGIDGNLRFDADNGNNQSSTNISFRTDGTEKIRIDSSGHVAFKTTDLGYPDYGDDLTIADSGHCGMTIRSGTSSNGTLYFSDDTGTAVGTYAGKIAYEHASNTMLLATNGTNRIVIDASGLVGIGQTPSSSDGSMLQITGNDGIQLKRSGQTNGFVIRPNASTDGIRFTQGGTGDRMAIDSSGRLLLGTNTSNYEQGGITQITVNPSSWSSGLGIGTQTNVSEGDGCGIDFFQKISLSGAKWNTARIGSHATGVTSSAYGDLRFSTMNATTLSERMRIDSGGKILMNHSSSILDETLQVRTHQAIGYGILVDETDSGGGTFMRFRVNGSIVGQIYGNGSATTFATSSDYRLKENISYDWDATTRLKNLKPARFNFKTDSSTTVDGFLAHEVSSVVPEAIGGEKDAVDSEGEPIYQSIDHSKLVPLLVKTILELEARIETLEG